MFDSAIAALLSVINLQKSMNPNEITINIQANGFSKSIVIPAPPTAPDERVTAVRRNSALSEILNEAVTECENLRSRIRILEDELRGNRARFNTLRDDNKAANATIEALREELHSENVDKILACKTSALAHTETVRVTDLLRRLLSCFFVNSDNELQWPYTEKFRLAESYPGLHRDLLAFFRNQHHGG